MQVLRRSDSDAPESAVKRLNELDKDKIFTNLKADFEGVGNCDVSYELRSSTFSPP